jgi:hypothetical protein
MNELSTVDINRLERLEDTIRKGLKSFIEVGLALAEIQRGQLYRAQYESFEEYCQERWQFTASRGRQLVGAVSAIATLPDELPRPANAAQAEALARIADEQRRTEVWGIAVQRASAEGRLPTAREIGEIDIELGDIFGDEEDGSCFDETSRGEKNMAEVREMFRRLAELLREASAVSDALARTSAKHWMLTSGSALAKHIRDARDHVNAAKPAGICPLCDGGGCIKCMDTGWMNSTRFAHFRRSG